MHNFDPSLEQAIQDAAFPILVKGRHGWDLPHTKNVVKYMKELLAHNPQLDVDHTVLLIAAYAHDIGYMGLFDTSNARDLQKILDKKAEHMLRGAEMLTKILTSPQFDTLTSIQKARAVHLVRVHDALKQLKDTDELLLMEADTLGGLDTSGTKPFEDPASGIRYLQGVKHARKPRFITKYGKQLFEKLFHDRQKDYL